MSGTLLRLFAVAGLLAQAALASPPSVVGWLPPHVPEGRLLTWVGVEVVQGTVMLLSTTPPLVLLRTANATVVAVSGTPTPLHIPGAAAVWLVQSRQGDGTLLQAGSLPHRQATFVGAYTPAGPLQTQVQRGAWRATAAAAAAAAGAASVSASSNWAEPEAQEAAPNPTPAVLVIDLGFVDATGTALPPTCNTTCALATLVAVAALFADSSQAAVQMDVARSVYSFVPSGLSVTTAACDVGTWAAAALSGFRGDATAFALRVIVLPYAAGAGTCGWVGLAYLGCDTDVGGCLAWVRSATPAVWVHELGHSFGLGHASVDANNDGEVDAGAAGEYGDASDPMGSAALMQRFGALHRMLLGWLPLSRLAVWPLSAMAAVSHQTLNGSSTTFDLATSSVDGGQLALPLLLRVDVPHGDPYWLSYRTVAGWDAVLPATWAPAVLVHRFPAAGDVVQLRALRTRLVARLSAVGASFADARNQLVLRLLRAGTDTATLGMYSCVRRAPTARLLVQPRDGAGPHLVLEVGNADSNCDSQRLQVLADTVTSAADSSDAAQQPFCDTVRAVLVPDAFPADMRVEIRRAAPGSPVLAAATGPGEHAWQLCAPLGMPHIAYFMDTAADGYCCFSGQGWYELHVGTTLVQRGGQFGAVDAAPFVLAPQWRTAALPGGAADHVRVEPVFLPGGARLTSVLVTAEVSGLATRVLLTNVTVTEPDPEPVLAPATKSATVSRTASVAPRSRLRPAQPPPTHANI